MKLSPTVWSTIWAPAKTTINWKKISRKTSTKKKKRKMDNQRRKLNNDCYSAYLSTHPYLCIN